MLKKILRIAGLEIKRSKESGSKVIDPYTAIIASLVILVLAAKFSLGLGTFSGIYPVSSERGEVNQLVESEPRFKPVKSNEVIKVSTEFEVTLDGSERSKSAYFTFLNKAEKNNTRKLLEKVDRGEIDASKVFPLLVRVENFSSFEEIQRNPERQNNSTGNTTESSENQSTSNQSSDTSDQDSETSLKPSLPSFDQIRALVQDTVMGESVRPSQLSTPLPYRSVLAAILILAPVILTSSLYSNSFQKERNSSKASLLFILPETSWEIIVGKSLPYLSAAFLAMSALIALFGGGLNLILYLSGLTLVLLYFSFHFAAVMIAKSSRDLSMLKMAIGSTLVSLLVIPIFFIEVTELSYLSPLSLIVSGLQGNPMNLENILMALSPSIALTYVNFRFFGSMFNEEEFLGAKTTKQKLGKGLAKFLKKKQNLFLYGIAAVPVALLTQLTLLPILTVDRSLWPLIIILGALFEEILRNYGTYLNLELHRKKFYRMLTGGIAGAGFGTGERILYLIVSNVQQLPSSAISPGFILPILFHTTLGVLFGLLYREKGRKAFLKSVIVVTVIHIIYNLAVLLLL